MGAGGTRFRVSLQHKIHQLESAVDQFVALRPFLFVSLRDALGVTQLTFISPDGSEMARSSLDVAEHQCLFDVAAGLKPESSISVQGVVQCRPEGMANVEMQTGEIELQVQHLQVLNEAAPIPLKIGAEEALPSEESRLKHRHIDLVRDATWDVYARLYTSYDLASTATLLSVAA